MEGPPYFLITEQSVSKSAQPIIQVFAPLTGFVHPIYDLVLLSLMEYLNKALLI